MSEVATNRKGPDAPLSLPGAGGAVVRQASGEQAANYIRRLIFDGELRAGMRLPQDQIAKALGVSRIPVREAIVALEREGWVTAELHRGAFVNSFDEGTIRDHYELFALIYGLAARRATARAEAEVLERLSGLARDIATTDDPLRVQDISVTFHFTVVGAAHSPRIPSVLRAMSALVPGTFFVAVPEAIEPAKKGLPAIVRAMKRGDGDKVAGEYTKMFAQQAEAVVALFQRRHLIRESETA